MTWDCTSRHNKLLQLSPMDSAEVSLPRNPAAVNGAAEPGRYTSLSSFAVVVCLFASLVSGCAAEPVNKNSVVRELTAAGEEGDVIPIRLCPPPYPRRAVLEGIEGFVEMMFDIDDSGTPINIEVMKSEPSGVFDAAALKSMECSKFKVRDERGRVTFTMEFRL